jgi:hypothetical protein
MIIGCYCHDKMISVWDRTKWSEEIKKVDVFVMVAQAFEEMFNILWILSISYIYFIFILQYIMTLIICSIEHGYFNWDNICLLVFDECHHCQKNDCVFISLYILIIIYYLLLLLLFIIIYFLFFQYKRIMDNFKFHYSSFFNNIKFNNNIGILTPTQIFCLTASPCFNNTDELPFYYFLFYFVYLFLWFFFFFLNDRNWKKYMHLKFMFFFYLFVYYVFIM